MTEQASPSPHSFVPPRLHSAPDSGDGWVEDGTGRKFWGRFGAAGLLAHDSARGILLQHRANWSHFGGTWGLPGGARHAHETAVEGAVREATEEAGIDAGALRLRMTSTLDLGFWSYTTVVVDVTTPFEAAATDAESIEVRWVPVAEVASLPLHPGFEASWPLLEAELLRRTILIVDSANVVGSRPDGWWKDRVGATERLAARLSALGRAGFSAEALGLAGAASGGAGAGAGAATADAAGAIGTGADGAGADGADAGSAGADGAGRTAAHGAGSRGTKAGAAAGAAPGRDDSAGTRWWPDTVLVTEGQARAARLAEPPAPTPEPAAAPTSGSPETAGVAGPDDTPELHLNAAGGGTVGNGGTVAADLAGRLELLPAESDGDQAIVDAVARAVAASDRSGGAHTSASAGADAVAPASAHAPRILVVTADRELTARVTALGATVRGPGWLLALLDEV